MRALFARVAATCDLPPLPAVAARAIRLARDPDARAEDLARVVETDATIAARVLRISRSTLYLRRQPPRTLRDAVLAVGFEGVRKILIAASLRCAYRADDPVASVLWGHALATALAADELGRIDRQVRGGDAFIAGLLHDVGRLVLHLADPEAYARLGHEDAVEERVFGVSHAAVGGCLAEQWNLELEVVEAITFHHAPAGSRLAEQIATADRIAHEIGFGSFTGSALPEEIAGTCEREAVGTHVWKLLAAERALFD
jgi:putative nucleotidyltransferase with HDIG domain